MKLHGKSFFVRRAGGGGWVYSEEGNRFWGLYGASGILLRLGEGEDALYLLLQRSYTTHHGGTWGIPGGALKRDEAPIEGAMRELYEETGIILPDEAKLINAVAYTPIPEWKYTTFVYQVEEMPEIEDILGEHMDGAWVSRDAAWELDLHPGFEAPFLSNRLG
jgi:8-oxo-dGTP diphosphatase